MWYQVSLVALSTVFILACDNQSGIDAVEQQADVIELRFGHDMHEASAQHLAALKFAELVSLKTAGTVLVTVYPDQRIGNDRQMVAMAQSGELDIIVPPTAKFSHIIPEMQLFDLPYLFPNRDLAHTTLDGIVGRTLLQKMTAHGLLGLAFWEGGFKQLTSNKPINNEQDFANQRFRIMESPVISDQFTFWGADTTAIDFANTYQALEDGVVDGQENPLSSIVGMNFHQVQKYLILSDHGYLSQVLAFSSKTFERLNGSQQRAIFAASTEATSFQRSEAKRIHSDLVAKINQQAIQVVTLDSATKAFMEKNARSVLEKYRPVFGSALIEQILQLRDSDKQYAENQLVIAIDADMSGNSALSGLSIRRGVELALDEINQSGGLLGKQVVLAVRDNSMIPARGLDNLEAFRKIPNLIAVFSGISSPVVLAELEFIHKHKLLFLDPWAAATPIIDNGFKPNYVFRVSVRDADAAGFLLQESLTIAKNVGLLLVNNPWGQSNYEALISALSEKGLTPVHTEWYDWGEKDFSNKLARLSEKEAKVIIFVGNAVEGAKIVHGLAKNKAAPAVVSHWGITGSNFHEMASPSLEKIDLRVLQTFSFINNHSPKARSLARRYHNKYFSKTDEDIIAPVGTAHAYDLTQLLALAIKQANSTDMEKVRDELEKIKHYKGLLKTYQPPFSEDDHDALDSSDFIFTRFLDGNIVPVNQQ